MLSPTTLKIARNILLIDDEVSILTALERTLKRSDFVIFTATNWREAEPILLKEDIAVVICDRHLKGESGIQILETLKTHFPKIIRIMLSADIKIDTLLSSINQGYVFRFIPKPWNISELNKALNDAIALRKVILERDEFEKSLIALNEDLEDRILNATNTIEILFQDLEQSFDQTIHVLLSILELNAKSCVEHSKRTAARVRGLSRILGISDQDRRVLQRAALLHWIGLTQVDDSFFRKHLWKKSKLSSATWEFHALLGQQALFPIKELKKESQIIANYLRPDLAPEKIQPCCHILAATSFFEHAVFVDRKGRSKLEPAEIDYLHNAFLKHYPFLDLAVVDALFKNVKGETKEGRESECDVNSLRKGMILSRPVITDHGIPIAPSGITIDRETLDAFREQGDSLSEIHVWEKRRIISIEDKED